MKQGDPSSAALYCLALEPFLVHLRNKMEGHGLNVLRHSFITSAYADDLCIICTKDEGFEIVNETLELYTSSSSAKVNFVKSIGLWCGSWRERKDSPLGLKWSNKGIKYLGVFLGNTVDFEKKSFSSIKNEIETVLKKWKHLAPILSCRGRVLIVNNLCASMLWHKVICMTIDDSVIKEIQKLFVTFFARLPKYDIYLSIDDGGQGLIDLDSRIKAFRLEYLRDLMYQPHICTPFLKYFLQTYYYDTVYHDLIRYDYIPLNQCNVPDLYKSLLKIWRSFDKERILEDMAVADILSELVYKDEKVGKFIYFQQLVDLSEGRWKTDEELFVELKISKSRRVFEGVILKNIKNKITEEWKMKITSFFTNKIDFGKNQIFDYNIVFNDKQIKLTDTQNRIFYLNILNFNKINLSECTSKWEPYLSNDYQDLYFNYKSCYAPLNILRDGDLSWGMMHGVVATGSLLRKMHVRNDDLCPFCSCVDNLFHIFYDCPRLLSLFKLLEFFIHNIFPELDVFLKEWWFYGVPYLYDFSLDRRKYRVCNWLIVLARKSVYDSRSNKLRSELPDGVLYIFKSRVKHRLTIEFQYAQFIGEIEKFKFNWCIYPLKCYIVGNNLTYEW